jgi:hypothetical protein
MQALEEIFMADYNPSPDFTAHTMESIRRYEAELRTGEKRTDTFLHSKQGFFILSAGGTLFGIIHFVRLASALLFPALCR